MAMINIHNLNAIGSDLFADAESYLQDLSESELNAQGGVCASTSWMEVLTTIIIRTL
jgi:hypothetical protein